jgi:hypothetical protein
VRCACSQARALGSAGAQASRIAAIPSFVMGPVLGRVGGFAPGCANWACEVVS